MRAAFTSITLISLVGGGLHAQRLAPRLAESIGMATERPDTSVHDGAMAFGGVVGVLGGTYGGIILGALSERLIAGQCSEDYGCLGGGILGFLAGEPAGVALGVHLANQDRGAFGNEFAANAAILVAGIFLQNRLARQSSCASCGEYLLLLGVPIAQVAASIAIEKATSPKPD